MEEYTCLEFMEESDLLKRELKKMMKTEQMPVSDNVKEKSQEEDAVEESEKEEKKPDEQLNNSKKAGTKCVTPGPRNKRPIRLKKTPYSQKPLRICIVGFLHQVQNQKKAVFATIDMQVRTAVNQLNQK